MHRLTVLGLLLAIFFQNGAKTFSQKRGTFVLSNELYELLISSLVERQTACQRASLLVMDTSQGESSQDIHSLNEINFSFIVLAIALFQVMKLKQFISKFRGYCMEFLNIRFLNPDFHTYFGQATIREWIEEDLKLFWNLERCIRVMQILITTTGFK